MAIEPTDFYNNFLNESPFYDDLVQLDKDNFNKWVTENFQEMGTFNSFEEVAPSKELIDDFIFKGYNHIESQCHYSAKAINLLNSDFEFWTGFVHRQDYLYRLVTHSFNLYDGNIIDFSRVDRNFNVLNVLDPYFPHIYYGIRIPNNIIEAHRQETLDEFSMRPLLVELYNNS